MSRAWRHHSLVTLIIVTYISHFNFDFLYFQVTQTRHVTCLTSPFSSYTDTDNCTYMPHLTFVFLYFQVTRTRHVTCLTSPFSSYAYTDNCTYMPHLTFIFLYFQVIKTRHVTCLTRAWHHRSLVTVTLIIVTYMYNYCTHMSHFTFGFLYFQLHEHDMSHACRHRSLVTLKLIIVHISHILLLASYIFNYTDTRCLMLDVTVLFLRWHW